MAFAWTLGGTAVTLTVNDDLGAPRNVAVPASGDESKYFRTFLSRYTSATGAATDPIEFLRYLYTTLGGITHWQFRLDLSGPSGDPRVVAVYKGAGNGSITFAGTAVKVRNALGFDANIGPLATNGEQIATYPPMFMGWTLCRSGDSGWTLLPQAFAASQLADGSTVVDTDGTCLAVRRFDSRLHPSTYTVKTNRGAAGTPMYGGAFSQTQSPSPTPTTSYTHPWSWWETIQAARDRQLGVAFGNFQALIAGTDTAIELCYLAPASFGAERPVRLSDPKFSERLDYTGIELVKYGDSARS
jgi:hypothetical protein